MGLLRTVFEVNLKLFGNRTQEKYDEALFIAH